MTREELIKIIHASFTENDKKFLLSVKRGDPQWDLLPIQNIDKLPAVRWKLLNLQKLDDLRRQSLFDRLNAVLYRDASL